MLRFARDEAWSDASTRRRRPAGDDACVEPADKPHKPPWPQPSSSSREYTMEEEMLDRSPERGARHRLATCKACKEEEGYESFLEEGKGRGWEQFMEK